MMYPTKRTSTSCGSPLDKDEADRGRQLPARWRRARDGVGRVAVQAFGLSARLLRRPVRAVLRQGAIAPHAHHQPRILRACSRSRVACAQVPGRWTAEEAGGYLGCGAGHHVLPSEEQWCARQLRVLRAGLPEVTMQKVSIIKRRKPLNGPLGLDSPKDFMAAVSSGYTELNVPGYHLLPCDLRDLDATTAKMEAAGIDRSVPTLFVSECVLIYMEAKFSAQLVAWAASYFDDVSFALYEQILPGDAFGKVMMANIKARGCDLLSIHDFPTVEAQITRFTEHNYEVAQCWDMNKIYYHYLNPAERAKNEKLEIFDELEEFHLLQAHYCVVVASKKTSTPSARALSLGEAKA
ncbi:S-adenosyl-L-methionine-dependent methyltransferase [Phytophthora cactorum]|nr:S-adenosyl-L-methionine-dependent methyltransferase [Phytophthora cactorum]